MKRAIAVLALAVAGGASAQVNKCVDRAGRVVAYGMECPAGTHTEATAIRSRSGGALAIPPKSLAERDAEFRKRQIEKQELAQKSAREAADAQEQQRACDNARAYLKSLQGGHRIARADARTGERAFLSDAEYPAEIARAQSVAAANCK